MKFRTSLLPAFVFSALAFCAGWVLGDRHADPRPSAVIGADQAGVEVSDWGTFHLYFDQETYGTMDVVVGTASILPGQQIHPPHEHAAEEYLMVTEGAGTWHLNGEEFPARKNDILYAAPWDVHGITNSSSDTLNFVVWKWSSKGMAVPGANSRKVRADR